MKRCLVTLAFFMLFSFGLLADQTVVMLDTSSSMLPYYDSVVDYFLGDILPPSKAPGSDTQFHFLTFSENVDEELIHSFDDEQAAVDIITRLLLLKPLGTETDLFQALAYLENYLSRLPSGGRRNVYLLTDGLHDLKTNQRPLASTEIHTQLNQSLESITQAGWTVTFVRFPLSEPGLTNPASAETTGEAGEGRVGAMESDYGSDYHSNSKVGTTSPSSSAFTAQQTGKESAPDNESASGKKSGEAGNTENQNSNQVARQGSDTSVTNTQTTSTRRDADLNKMRDDGQSSTANTSVADGNTRDARSGGSRRALTVIAKWILIILAILLILALIIYVIIRQINKSKASTVRVIKGMEPEASSLPAPLSASEFSNITTEFEPNGERPLEMRVSSQNPKIGFRNIKRVTEKARFIGGGNSYFLVFVVPMPVRIGKIHKSGNNYVFTPLKMEFFPELSGEVHDCLGKPIPFRSKHGHRFLLLFQEYVSPLEKLNLIMNMTTHQGVSREELKAVKHR